MTMTTTMPSANTWIDRYVEAVKRYLPSDRRADVGDELQSLLAGKLADAETTKGAALDDDEIAELIRGTGHPLKVASGYQDQRVLISEPVFPVYVQTLKYLAMTLLVVSLVVVPLRALGADLWNPFAIAARIVGTWLEMALFAFAGTTLLFFALDGYLGRTDLYRRWDPRTLPRVSPGRTIPLFDTIVELVAGVAFLTMVIGVGDGLPGEALPVRLTEVASVAWQLLAALIAGDLLLSLVNLYRPYWTLARLRCSAALGLAVAGVAVWLALIDRVLIVDPTATSLGALLDRLGPIRPISFGVVALFAAGDAVGKLRKLRAVGR